MRAVAVQHTGQEHPGHLRGWLADAGVPLEPCLAYAGQPLPAVTELDALVVLGGPMGATEDDRAPWLPGVRRLMADAVGAGVPTLGICLGAQLLAVATGGAVRRGEGGPEIGMLPVTLLAGAADDPLLAGVPATPVVPQWHFDAIEAGPDAVVLARSERYPVQALRVGERAWGLQFHPEVTAEQARVWAAADAGEIAAGGRDPEAVAGEIADAQAEVTATWRAVADRFAGVVRRCGGRA